MSRVAFIGIDAAESTYVESLMSEGHLPALDKLRGRSVWVDMTSETTWRSGRVWETFLVGTSDYPLAVIFDPDDYSTHIAGARPLEPFYRRVPDAHVVVMDVPYMNLLHPAPGAQITAWGGHDAGYPRASNPPGLI